MVRTETASILAALGLLLASTTGLAQPVAEQAPAVPVEVVPRVHVAVGGVIMGTRAHLGHVSLALHAGVRPDAKPLFVRLSGYYGVSPGRGSETIRQLRGGIEWRPCRRGLCLFFGGDAGVRHAYFHGYADYPSRWRDPTFVAGAHAGIDLLALRLAANVEAFDKTTLWGFSVALTFGFGGRDRARERAADLIGQAARAARAADCATAFALEPEVRQLDLALHEEYLEHDAAIAACRRADEARVRSRMRTCFHERRAEVIRRRAAGATGAALVATLPACDATEAPARARAWHLLGAATDAGDRGACTEAASLARELAELDRDVSLILAPHPALERCRQACREARIPILRRAHAATSADERARILATLPTCDASAP